MPNDTEDTRKPRGKCIQIKGASDDKLITRMEAFSKKVGVPVATLTRILLKKALDLEEGKP